ncbi:response regulator [Bradyrhizobium sp.]|uniref:response regulator transcription factor n=1 Tax=Bradyrhizobium sp. TaxID=376 RepID=UPI00261506C6|nr:response regulator [Bradyrhizobium sp.]
MQDRSNSRGQIFVVDDDASTRQSLSSALEPEGYEVICFADGAALLSSARECIPACIFIEVRLPEKSGIDVLKQLRAEDYPAPIFVTSGQGDIPMAVDAIRNGASDFIEKPVTGDEIVGRVRAVVEPSPGAGNGSDFFKKSSLRLPGRDPLTRRERDVLMHLVDGASNKEIARRLNIGSRTVESHRASILRKAGVRRAAELVRLVLRERHNL